MSKARKHSDLAKKQQLARLLKFLETEPDLKIASKMDLIGKVDSETAWLLFSNLKDPFLKGCAAMRLDNTALKVAVRMDPEQFKYTGPPLINLKTVEGRLTYYQIVADGILKDLRKSIVTQPVNTMIMRHNMLRERVGLEAIPFE